MDELQLLFVGDVMLGRMVNRMLRTAAPEYPWGDTLPLFAEADFRVCNLESAICGRGKPWPACAAESAPFDMTSMIYTRGRGGRGEPPLQLLGRRLMDSLRSGVCSAGFLDPGSRFMLATIMLEVNQKWNRERFAVGVAHCRDDFSSAQPQLFAPLNEELSQCLYT